MAKSQTAKSSTIKNDPFGAHPYDSVIPDRISGQQAKEAPRPKPASGPRPASGPGQVADSHQASGPEEPKGVITSIRPEPEAKPALNHKKEKLTVHLTHDLIERVKNAAYWNPRLTIASIAELGVRYAIEQVEAEHGGPYPPREAELKGGRPIGS